MIYDIIPCETEEKWHAVRRQHIGASEIGTVLGLNQYQTALDLWALKTGKQEPADLSDVEAVDWGKRLEPVVIEAFSARTGRDVMPQGTPDMQEVFVSREHPVLACTLDAWCVCDVEPGCHPLEVKTTSSYREADWEEGVPDYYMSQIQQQMLVTGSTRATIAVLIGGQKLVWQDVEACDVWQRRIIYAAEEFWGYVERREQPPIDPDAAGTAKALARLYPVDDGRLIELGGGLASVTDEIETLRAERKALDTRLAVLDAHVKDALRTAQIGVLPDGRQWCWKTTERAGYTVAPKTTRTLRLRQSKKED